MSLARDLELRHLTALTAVAETGTFGRAAQRLGYTQSAVSQQIAALERTVGAPLFDRPGGPRPVTLTPLGKILVDHAGAVLERVDAAATDIERFQAGTIGRIDIGTFQSVSTALLPSLLARLRAERPNIEARLVEDDDHEELVRQTIDGHLDVSFLVGDTPADIETIDLIVDPFVVLALPDVVGDDAVPAPLLNDTPLIGEQDSPCQRTVDQGLYAIGVTPDYVFRTSDNSAIAAMVRAGMGMAVVPLLSVELEDPRIAVRHLDPPIPPRRIAIGWRRDRTLSPAAERFIEITREMTAELRDRQLASIA
ncbi:MAG: LysR family transcriptional regulator [Actinobacteria bacterium]|nr:LysR family transcriptional regulator [Actinomycetota bacterium]